MLAVGQEARHVAAVYAASGQQKIGARPPGNAAKLHLALKRRPVGDRLPCAERKADIFTQAFMYHAHDALASMALFLGKRPRQLLNPVERRQQLPPGLLYFLLMPCPQLLAVWTVFPVSLLAYLPPEESRRRERPDQSGTEEAEQRLCTTAAALAPKITARSEGSPCC